MNEAIYLDPFIPNLLDECYSMCCDWTESRESASNTTGNCVFFLRIKALEADFLSFVIRRMPLGH